MSQRKRYINPWRESVLQVESLRDKIAAKLAECESNFRTLDAANKHAASLDWARLSGALDAVNYILKHCVK